MEVFVLSISRFEVLDLLEVFDSYEHAYEYAIRFCDIAAIAPKYRLERRSDQMRGWVIAENPQYFISILERKVSILAPATSLVSYNTLNDIVSGKTPVIMHDPMLIADPVTLANVLPNLTPVPVPPTLLDDPYADNLPAGFHHTNSRPLVMDDVKNDPYGVASIDALSENQKWALVIARVNKRPYFEIDVDGFYPFSFSQSAALKVLKVKNRPGQVIRDKELNLLQAFYDKCINDQKSSENDYYDESSSKDEESEF